LTGRNYFLESKFIGFVQLRLMQSCVPLCNYKDADDVVL